MMTEDGKVTGSELSGKLDRDEGGAPPSSVPSNTSSPVDSGVSVATSTLNDMESDILPTPEADPKKSSMESQLAQMPKLPQDTDSMNISLTSYELLDYTAQNRELSPKDQMHISVSEEVNETLKISTIDDTTQPTTSSTTDNPDQIVYRRQRTRKRSSKSDTPKKRVSFHEDILNSTRVDDVHIFHGFVTTDAQQKGRYSWAAEGDDQYRNKPKINERRTRSDLYANRFKTKNTSTVSSSSSVFSSSTTTSSIDEENDKEEDCSNLPKNGCLKKSPQPHSDDYLLRQNWRKSDSQYYSLNASNLFGSLKNILKFSTSLPAVKNGVFPDLNAPSSQSSTDQSEIDEPTKVNHQSEMRINAARRNLKLTKSEGFYPNYPNTADLSENIVICHSSVYEHHGISYSYEYDQFQKSFEPKTEPKSHSDTTATKFSTLYRSLLKELNFFRTTATQIDDGTDEFEIIAQIVNAKSNYDEDVAEIVLVDDEHVQKSSHPKCESQIMRKCCDFDKIKNEISAVEENHSSYSSPSRHLASPKRFGAQSPLKSLFKGDTSCGTLKSKSSSSEMTCNASKTSLINRFLRNVTVKKVLDTRAQRNQQKTSTSPLNLYIKDVNYSYKGPDEVDTILEQEIKDGTHSIQATKVLDINRELESWLRRDIIRNNEQEIIYKVFRIRSTYDHKGHSKPQLLVLSNTILYVVNIKSPSYDHFYNHFVLPYIELSTILIGPNGQILYLSNYEKDMQCFLVTGCAQQTQHLITEIIITMGKNPKLHLPAIKQLTLDDMVKLKRTIRQQSSIDGDEEYFFYSIVNLEDSNKIFDKCCDDTKPFGPVKEGYLMWKNGGNDDNSNDKWDMGYFVLKAGALYLFEAATDRMPQKWYRLMNGTCLGAGRLLANPRPYTFYLNIDNNLLYLGAANEFDASDWLQCLIQGIRNFDTLSTELLNGPLPVSCSLVVTTDHIVALRENLQIQHFQEFHPMVLSCAAICDLLTFKLPPIQQQNWCILEFNCSEVHESSGDWILYFASNYELHNFLTTIKLLWTYCKRNDDGNLFPQSILSDGDPVGKICIETYVQLLNGWPSNAVHLQVVPT